MEKCFTSTNEKAAAQDEPERQFMILVIRLVIHLEFRVTNRIFELFGKFC